MSFEKQPNRRNFLKTLAGLYIGAVARADKSAATTFGFDEETYKLNAEKRLLEIEKELERLNKEWLAKKCVTQKELDKECTATLAELQKLLGEKSLIESALKQ